MADINTNEHANTLDFIYDWQKRSNKQQVRQLGVISVLMAVVILGTFMMFYWYQSQNYERIMQQNLNFIQDSALVEAEQVESKLNDGIWVVRNFASQYAQLNKFGNLPDVESRLAILNDKNLFDRIAFVDLNGKDVSLEGVSDVKDRDYFKAGLSGKSGYDYLEKSRTTGEPTVVFYAPVRSDGEIIGVMLGFYELDRLESIIAYEQFNYTPTSYLIMGDGTVVADSKDERTTGNLFERMQGYVYDGDVDYDEIMAAIDDSDRTSTTFRFIKNAEVTLGVVSQFTHSDWMIVSTLPYSVSAGMQQNADAAGRTMLLVILSLFVFLFLVLFSFLFVQRKRMRTEMQAATDQLKESLEHDHRQSHIIESLGNSFSSIYYIDANTLQYERINEENKDVQVMADYGDWTEAFNIYIGKWVEKSYHNELYESFVESLSDFAEFAKADQHISVEYLRKDGSWRRGLMVPAEKGEDGRVNSVIFAVRKIDDEKRTESATRLALQQAYDAAQLASNAKTTFLSNMSHDIRTPMNAIVGMTAIAGANLDNKDKVSDCLKKITSASKQLLGLINEVLDMSKIESGTVDLSDDEFSLSELIDELITVNSPLIRAKNHALTVKVNNLVHEKVIGDQNRLMQVFTNLLSNAIKYTPDNGNIEICVSEKNTNKSTIGWYEVVFKDNGIGMSEEFVQRLFEPFSRAADDRIKNIQGTGLGMAISRNIIRMMNGDITVESALNKGSTFTVTFTLKLQEEEEVDLSRFVDLPVLVVDDDETACESTCLILNDIAMKSEYVLCGEEAVQKTIEHHKNDDDYYAVIVDWQMPGMNGIETTREIRRIVGENVPIIVMSAYDWSDIENEAIAAGVNAFVSKPMFKSKLVGVFAGLMADNNNNNNNAVKAVNDLSNLDYSGRNILIAEDNDLNYEIISELLSMTGIHTDRAENGRECVEMFQASENGHYDMIFMDIQMPIMDGNEAARAIRATVHPQSARIPIIAMTANAFSSDVRAAFDSGMNGHVAKPVNIGVIMKTLQEYLG